jgi:signal transduction histidine kinase
MKNRYLGGFGIALAVACWAALLFLRHFLFGLPLSVDNVFIELLLVATGSWLFWRWILNMLNRQAATVEQYTEHLKGLHAASITLSSEHDLKVVLQKVVDLSRYLTNAKYAALGVLDPEGDGFEEFITSGMSAAARQRIGSPPKGRGLLGVLIQERQAVRVDHIADDPRSSGFPENHPHMYSFLGVPIVFHGQVFGNLYLCDKLPRNSIGYTSRINTGNSSFTTYDQEVLEMFAAQAAIIIENAQLYREIEEIAILNERERFGMDLHDGVIQAIYAIGLMLDDARHRVESEPALAHQRIQNAIASINTVIADIRSYIHDLHAQDLHASDLQQGLQALVEQANQDPTLQIVLHMETRAPVKLTSSQITDLIHVAREAISNVRKHAKASETLVHVTSRRLNLELLIQDNGTGMVTNPLPATGYGLENMQRRVHALNGTLEIDSELQKGTRISVTVPYKR